MERRQNRSRIVGEALDLLLKSSADRHELHHMVLSDEHGLLVASNRNGDLAESLAVAGRLMAQGEGAMATKSSYPGLGVHSFSLDKQKLYLSWNGPRPISPAQAMDAAKGVRRILSGR